MPLAFESLSHGTVAFGFFNIELDMLLLERCFFFAEPFCAAVADLLAPVGPGPEAVALPGWRIRDPARVGNVNLAIPGLDRSGFIGETYRRFPFPEDPAEFKQRPHVEAHRPWAEAAIARFGEAEILPLRRDPVAGTVALAEHAFGASVFEALIAYVDRGGYPRWRDEERPAYVTAMLARLGGRAQ